EGPEDLPQRLCAQRDLGLLVRERQVLVRDEVAELRLVLVADGLLERDRRLRAAADVLDLLGAEFPVPSDLGGRLPAPPPGAELALAAGPPVQRFRDLRPP